jgi:hypothetical protein
MVPISCLTAQLIYNQEFRFGLGGVSLGNEFNKHTDKEAEDTLEAAWSLGSRYFDVAPWYGFGLVERRFGHFLHNKKREDYLLSSKVGKLFKASKNNRHAAIYIRLSERHRVRLHGGRRAPLDRGQPAQRLGVDSSDVAFVHDISPDFAHFPNGWEERTPRAPTRRGLSMLSPNQLCQMPPRRPMQSRRQTTQPRPRQAIPASKRSIDRPVTYAAPAITMMTMSRSTDWSREFEDSVTLPNGRQLFTLKEAAASIMKLPEAEQALPEWQTTMQEWHFADPSRAQ